MRYSTRRYPGYSESFGGYLLTKAMICACAQVALSSAMPTKTYIPFTKTSGGTTHERVLALQVCRDHLLKNTASWRIRVLRVPSGYGAGYV